MTDSLIPEDTREFILQTIDSIVQLEALLLLRANRELEWDVDAIAGRLYIKMEAVVPWLERLCNDGCLVSINATLLYRYQPRSTELEQSIDRLADVYAEQLVAVTHLIHSKPRTRVQKFADAFRLRKD